LIAPLVAVAVATWPSTVHGEEYWVAYEGQQLPEKLGWNHNSSSPPARRLLENGSLTIDGLDDVRIFDFYQNEHRIDPAPGELFLLQWRVLVSEVRSVRGLDPGVSVFSDSKWAVGFELGVDRIVSAFEGGAAAYFEPGVFHEFELHSTDMRQYELLIDGELARRGEFWLSLVSSRVGWGDVIFGAASLSTWDYVRFGVVPEPSACVIVLGLFLGHLKKMRLAIILTLAGAAKRLVLGSSKRRPSTMTASPPLILARTALSRARRRILRGMRCV
jgi:hypothetical protein